VKKILITYSQRGNIVLEKNENDIEANGNVVSVKLTQEETNLFQPEIVDIQVRVLSFDDNSMSSQIFHKTVKEVLNDEVLQ
jgi:hypothetical protein